MPSPLRKGTSSRNPFVCDMCREAIGQVTTRIKEAENDGGSMKRER